VVCTGARAAIATALASVDHGGTVSFFAPMGPGECYPLPFDNVFWQRGVRLTSSYGAAPQDLRDALELVSGGYLDFTRLITHRLPLSQIQAGFELMIAGGDSMKIIVDPRLDA
jgi:L-iditol 2-dehydrogenase